jgi:hypothetical protein
VSKNFLEYLHQRDGQPRILTSPKTPRSQNATAHKMATATPPTLKHVLNISVIPDTPLNVGATPRGKANWVSFSSGTVTTPSGQQIATVVPGGGDYCTRHVEELVLSVDLRVIAKSNGSDESFFKFDSRGFDKLIPPVMGVLDGQVPPAPPSAEDMAKMPKALYGTEVISVDTSSREWAWLNFAVLVARVALVLGPKGVESVDYEVFQVVV